MNETDTIITERNFLTRPPRFLLKWGTLVFTSFFLLSLVFASILKFNEVIQAEIIITSENPPVDLFSKVNGKLEYLNFSQGQKVNKEELLAVIENTSRYEDVLYLDSMLVNTGFQYESLEDLYNDFPSTLELSVDLHRSYQKFLDDYRKYLIYVELGEEQEESENIELRIDRLRKQIWLKQDQLKSLKRNLSLAEQKSKRQKQLLAKGVISDQEYESVVQESNIAKIELNKIQQELEKLYVDSLSLFNLNQKSFNRNYISKSVYFSDLQLSKQALEAQLKEWESLFTLKSPLDGTVTVFDIWNNNQNVQVGEHVITIVPNDSKTLIGKCKVPIRNSAKIRTGQAVVIKLENYPFQEWGMLSGSVLSVSEIPKKEETSFYTVYVDISTLQTTYGKEIQFKQELYGAAKIILNETSLLERIFYQFRGLWTSSQF